MRRAVSLLAESVGACVRRRHAACLRKAKSGRHVHVGRHLQQNRECANLPLRDSWSNNRGSRSSGMYLVFVPHNVVGAMACDEKIKVFVAVHVRGANVIGSLVFADVVPSKAAGS